MYRSTLVTMMNSYEPRHDKTNKMRARPAKTQISLGIRPVWSESSLGAQWVAKNPSFLHADSENSHQTGRCPGWSVSSLGAHSFCWFCHVAAQYSKTSTGMHVHNSYRPDTEAVSSSQNKELFDLRNIICLRNFESLSLKISTSMQDKKKKLRSMVCISCHCRHRMTSQMCCRSNWRGQVLMAW